jgi:hypothetical protein
LAEAVMRFSRQRGAGLSVFAALSVLILWAHHHFNPLLPHLAYLTGWILFALILLLTLYNGRKKLPFLPMFSSEAWLQFHIYCGLITGALFVVHINYKTHSGWFQGALAWLYLLVMASGIFGLFLSRTVPRRLTTRGGEVLFERIPIIRRRLREETEELALRSIEQSKSGTIAEFYWRELASFFEAPRHLASHLADAREPLNLLLTRIDEVDRYLNQEERATMEKIATLVRQKDGLDYHYAHQWLLRAWLFVHIPLTYGLLLFILAHIVMVFAFSGGAG